MKAVRFTWEALRAAVIDLARRPVSAALSLLAMTLAAGLLGSFLLVSLGMHRLVAGWIDQAVVDVYLERDLPSETRDALRDEIARDPLVRRVDTVSPAQALEEFERLFPDLGDVEELLGENPFPGSLRIVPARADDAAFEELLERIRTRPGVVGVRYDRDWVAAVARAARGLSHVVLGGVLLLLASALMTIASVVRLALDDKRDEVALMRLVGAPALFVISPVLLSGALLGGAGALLAVLLVGAGRSLLLAATAGGPFAGWVQVLFGAPLPPGVAAAIVLGGFLAGAAAAAVATGRSAFG